LAGGEDLFVHQTAIVSEGFRSLREGEAVEFFVETSDDGRQKAVNVTGEQPCASIFVTLSHAELVGFCMALLVMPRQSP
jgi:hypothetical protein